jgi:hypothetical protein
MTEDEKFEMSMRCLRLQIEEINKLVEELKKYEEPNYNFNIVIDSNND